MTPPTAPERCPTCDREGCGKEAAYAAYQASEAGDDTLPLAMAMIAAERECLDLEVEAKHARRAREAVARRRAFNELRSAAAQWAKVAPLIERLRAECGEPPFRGRIPSLIECAAAILAATEATP